jgi:hypothetical protein
VERPRRSSFQTSSGSPGFSRRQRGVETGTLENSAADALVGENLPAPRSFQRVALEGEILVCRRDSGIANKHRKFSNGFPEPTTLRFDYDFFLFEKRSFSGQDRAK